MLPSFFLELFKHILPTRISGEKTQCKYRLNQ